MHVVGIVWPTPWNGTPPDIRGSLLDKLDETLATHLRLNLDHRNPQASDLVAQARAAGFEVLPILDLDYKNPDIAAYCDFCEAIVERERFPIVEILNEPKTMEGMSSQVYHDIATAVATRLQRFRPQTRIAVAGDFIRFDRLGPRLDTWLQEAQLDPALFDLIAVHPYREPGKPTVTRFASRAEEYGACREHLGGLPLIVTEVGWNLAEVTEDEQAAYLYEELTINRDSGIEATFVYSMVSEQTTGMGVFRDDQTPRPAVEALARFQREQTDTVPVPEPEPEWTEVLVPVLATVGAVEVSGTLKVRVRTGAPQPGPGPEPEPEPDPVPEPLKDLHIWVTDSADHGIPAASVTIAGETRIASGEGHAHFPVAGPVKATLETAGYHTRVETLHPGNRRVALERIAPPPVTLQRLHVESNARWFANADTTRFDWREVTAFGLYALWLMGQHDAARTFAKTHRALGFTVLRVLFTLDNEYWRRFNRVCGPATPGYWESLAPFLLMCAQEGMHVRDVLIGDLTPFGGQPEWTRRPDIYTGAVQRRAEDFCLRQAQEVREHPHVSMEIANEGLQIGMRDSFPKMVALGQRLKQLAPQTLLCGGSPDGNADQRVDFIRDPFDWCDAHIERLMGAGGFEWIKRSGEYMPIDQPADHWPTGQPRKPMPFVSGEPVNFGENRLDGHTGDVEPSLAVAFCYGAVSRARHYNACYHYDGGLFANLPKPETVASIGAFMKGLDAFPMDTRGKWRGHWAESFFRGDIYPAEDEDRIVRAHVDAGKGPWRVFGAGDYAATICEPANWDYRRGLKPGVTVELVARIADRGYASGVYQRR